MDDPYLRKLLTTKEKIIFQTRQHWLSLLVQLLPEILSVAAITILASVIITKSQNPGLSWIYLLNLIPFASFVRDILRWRFHRFIVSNRRIIHISGVFARNVNDSSLNKVNDINLEQSMLGRLLDFGNLEILTASELGVERYAYVASPIRFKKAILEAQE